MLKTKVKKSAAIINILGVNHIYKGEGVPFDPEGFMSTPAAIVQVIFGFLVGQYIQLKGKNTDMLSGLFVAGIVLTATGYCWDLVFPINKKIWTSSYVVHMAGVDMLIIGILIALIDVGKLKSGFTFFNIFGTNSMLAYIVAGAFAKLLLKLQVNVADENGILKPMSRYNHCFKNCFQGIGNNQLASFLFAITFMLVCWATLYVAYRKKWFLKV